MTSIYVREQGARVGRRGERLTVSKDGLLIQEFPLAQVDQVVLLGNVQLTAQATATLLERDIDVVYLSSYGKYRGRLTAGGGSQAQLRLQQMQRANDPSFRLSVVRGLVTGKIENQARVLQQLRVLSRAPGDRTDRRAGEPLFQQAVAGMAAAGRQALQAPSVDSVRGHEGRAAAFYFAAIRALLDSSWGFERRAYHPPPDPFNALLSLLYSLLLKDVLAAVNVVGLDPYLGFFHEPEDGRPSLALDLMEEWRPLVADTVALTLIRDGSITPSMFDRSGNPRRPVSLGETGMQLVLRAYGEHLETTIYHPLAGPGGNSSMRMVLTLQARHMARVIQGKESRYKPVRGS